MRFDPLVGGYPAVYGLLGAFTFLLWARLGEEHANQFRAFTLIGFLLGIAVAIVLAYLIYRGAVKLNLGKFFTVTGVLLVFVAAGILAYGVHDLQEAGILPGLYTLAFDVSAAVPADSWYGTLLKGVFNFSPQTTVLEAVVWVLYVAIVLTLFLRRPRRREAPVPGGATDTAGTRA